MLRSTTRRSANFGQEDTPAASSDVFNICDVMPGGRRLSPSRMALSAVLSPCLDGGWSSRFRRPGHPNSVRAVSGRYSRPLARWEIHHNCRAEPLCNISLSLTATCKKHQILEQVRMSVGTRHRNQRYPHLRNTLKASADHVSYLFVAHIHRRAMNRTYD